MWAQMWTAGATNKLKGWLKKDKSLKNKAEETREKIGEGERVSDMQKKNYSNESRQPKSFLQCTWK